MSIQGSVNQVIRSIGVAASISKDNKLKRDKLRQELAQKQMMQQQEAKKTQRRNFMDYISSMPSSFGGTVGDLPKDMQKQIASQYSKSQRKTMMDRMDKEKANGKSK